MYEATVSYSCRHCAVTLSKLKKPKYMACIVSVTSKHISFKTWHRQQFCTKMFTWPFKHHRPTSSHRTIRRRHIFWNMIWQYELKYLKRCWVYNWGILSFSRNENPVGNHLLHTPVETHFDLVCHCWRWSFITELLGRALKLTLKP